MMTILPQSHRGNQWWSCMFIIDHITKCQCVEFLDMLLFACVRGKGTSLFSDWKLNSFYLVSFYKSTGLLHDLLLPHLQTQPIIPSFSTIIYALFVTVLGSPPPEISPTSTPSCRQFPTSYFMARILDSITPFPLWPGMDGFQAQPFVAMISYQFNVRVANNGEYIWRWE